MITKAIVEDIVNPYSIRIRIPSLDRTAQSSVHTSNENLHVALVCTLPGCDPNIKPGDIVFISKDDSENEPIIIGYLYRSKQTDTYCDMILSQLSVNSSAKLPEDTSIGNVSSFEISQLRGVTGNLQDQLNQLKSEIDRVSESINIVTGGST